MKNNFVSIITPSYNSEKFISEAIRSVIKQTYQNWEMIIIDDASLDGANKIIEMYTKKDSRIKLIKLKKNSGPGIARNTGIKEAKGRYIAFLDADDLWKPNKLEKQIQFMKKNNIALTYSAYEIIDRYKKLLKNIINPPLKVSYNDLLKSNYIGCLTAVYDSKKIGKMYMPLISKRQDYALWLSILKKIDFAFGIKEPLATYRFMANSVSSNKFKLIKYNYLVFRNLEGFSILKSLKYLTWNVLNKTQKIFFIMPFKKLLERYFFRGLYRFKKNYLAK